jgi:chromosomal replication initiator protein
MACGKTLGASIILFMVDVRVEEIWKSVIGELEVSMTSGNFNTWFSKTNIIYYSNGHVIIGVPNSFAIDNLKKRYSEVLFKLLQKNGLELIKIEYKAVVAKKTKTNHKIVDEPFILDQLITQPPKKMPNVIADTADNRSVIVTKELNNKYTFDTFVEGTSNQMAFAAAQSVANNPGDKYNPLFLYGGVGIGKTHLIQAIGNEVKKKFPDKKVVYISSEQFINEFLSAIRYRKVEDFSKHYRQADVLIVDDIQFIAGKEKTQEQFFHTFNDLHQANKQIIISSDKQPSDIPTLEDRLKSRFGQGIVIDMQVPDYETRCVIIQSKSEIMNLKLPEDVIEYMASIINTNIRDLEGVLSKLEAVKELKGMVLDLPTVEALLDNPRNIPRHLTPKSIVEKTAKYFSVSLDDIRGPKRDRFIMEPRQIAMYLMRSELKLSFPKIVVELGRKDHTTAMHSVEKMHTQIRTNPMLQQHIHDIKEKLYA